MAWLCVEKQGGPVVGAWRSGAVVLSFFGVGRGRVVRAVLCASGGVGRDRVVRAVLSFFEQANTRDPPSLRRPFVSVTRSTDVLKRQFPSLHTTNAQTPNCRNCVEKSKMRARLHLQVRKK